MKKTSEILYAVWLLFLGGIFMLLVQATWPIDDEQPVGNPCLGVLYECMGEDPVRFEDAVEAVRMQDLDTPPEGS